MKKLLSIILAVALIATMFVGCSQAPASSSAAPTSQAGSESASASSEAPKENKSVEDIKAAGKLVMVTEPSFPPFEYMDGDKVVGVDVDIATEIAKDLGVELEVVSMDFDGLIAGLKSGKGDLIAAGMTVNPDREKEVDFSTKYIKSKQHMLVKKGAAYKALADLKDKNIGVQTGTSGDFLVTDAIDLDDGALHGSKSQVERFKSPLEAAMSVSNGKLAAVVLDEHPAKAIAAKNSDLMVVETPVSSEEEYAIAVDKGNASLLAAINTTLDRLIKEGKVSEYMVNHTAK